MPHHSRNAMRQQAKIIRETGETVWLLISTNAQPARGVAWNIIAADQPVTTADVVQPIYAYVEWHTDEVTYDEAGHEHNLMATIVANVQYMHPMQACYGVKFSDGTILRKTGEMLSDMRTSYAITVAGMANVVN